MLIMKNKNKNKNKPNGQPTDTTYLYPEVLAGRELKEGHDLVIIKAPCRVGAVFILCGDGSGDDGREEI